MSFPGRSFEQSCERFSDFVAMIPFHSCWEWTGRYCGPIKSRYGNFWNGKKSERAHRFSWRMHHGEIPSGMDVLHRCDNMMCVNPDHLFLGTKKDNAMDMAAKGRSTRGQKNAMAKLSDDAANDVVLAIGRGIETQKEIASRHGISREMVSRIKRGLAWRHLRSRR